MTLPTAPTDHILDIVSNNFTCDECEFTSNTDHGVKLHKGHQHKNTQKSEEFSDVIPQLDGPAEETLGLMPDREVTDGDSVTEEMDLSHLPTADDCKSFYIYISNLNQERIENMSKQELNHMNAELARKIAFKNAVEKKQKKKHTKYQNRKV